VVPWCALRLGIVARFGFPFRVVRWNREEGEIRVAFRLTEVSRGDARNLASSEPRLAAETDDQRGAVRLRPGHERLILLGVKSLDHSFRIHLEKRNKSFPRKGYNRLN
jgi:hypothetical protein